MIRAAVAGVIAASPRATASIIDRSCGGLEVLEQVAPGSGPDGGEQVLLVLADREHHDRRLGSDRGDRPGRLARRTSPASGRPSGRGPGRAAGRGRRLARRPAARPTTSCPQACEQRRDPVPEQGVVVGEHDPHQAVARPGRRPARGRRRDREVDPAAAARAGSTSRPSRRCCRPARASRASP